MCVHALRLGDRWDYKTSPGNVILLARRVGEAMTVKVHRINKAVDWDDATWTLIQMDFR